MMPQRDGSDAAAPIGGRVTRARAGLGFACLALLLSCGDSSGPGDLEPGPIASVILIDGQDQSGVVGTELPLPLRVRVVDADDRPIPGQIVNFRVVQGGGSVFAGAALTNADGVAQERWTVGTNASEEQRLEVRAVDPDTGEPVVFGVFRATALPSTAQSMELVTEPSSPVQSRISFTTQPAVRLNDAHANPVGAGVVVTAVLSGPGTLGGTTTATTGSNGIATFSNLSIAGVIGYRDVSFSAPGVTGVTATVLVIAGLPAIVSLHEGNNQSVVIDSPVSQAPAVRVTDADGNVVGAGVGVTFAVSMGGGSVTGASSTTNSEGIARVGSWTLGGNPGANALTATSPGLAQSEVTFSATGLAAFKAQSVSGGDLHTCALSLAGVAYCWGGNAKGGNYTGGQLGIGEAGGSRPIPTPVVGGLSFQSLLAGAAHTCGLTSSGAAYCWGFNYLGQVGDGSVDNRYAPVAVTGGLTFQNLALGGDHTCGVVMSGAAYCWGEDSAGQLGDGANQTRTSPVAVLGGLAFQSLVAGDKHTCGLVSGGTAYCWGKNLWGELGNGLEGNRSDPDAVAGGLSFQQLTAGTSHTCGLTSSGTAYCWGQNQWAQLGDGTNGNEDPAATTRRTPVPVAGGLTFTQLSAGWFHTCGLTASGAAYCWGRNDAWQLGDGTSTLTDMPTPVAGGIVFRIIEAGTRHTCGIAADDTVYCWGVNGLGISGTGTQEDYVRTPRKVRAP